MSSLELAYLLMAIAVFVIFAAVLAYYSHAQSVEDRRRTAVASSQPDKPIDAIAAH